MDRKIKQEQDRAISFASSSSELSKCHQFKSTLVLNTQFSVILCSLSCCSVQ